MPEPNSAPDTAVILERMSVTSADGIHARVADSAPVPASGGFCSVTSSNESDAPASATKTRPTPGPEMVEVATCRAPDLRAAP